MLLSIQQVDAQRHRRQSCRPYPEKIHGRVLPERAPRSAAGRSWRGQAPASAVRPSAVHRMSKEVMDGRPNRSQIKGAAFARVYDTSVMVTSGQVHVRCNASANATLIRQLFPPSICSCKARRTRKSRRPGIRNTKYARCAERAEQSLQHPRCDTRPGKNDPTRCTPSGCTLPAQLCTSFRNVRDDFTPPTEKGGSFHPYYKAAIFTARYGTVPSVGSYFR